MINISFNQGVFPNILKIANVIPIHKKGDKLGCNNYRPISLLSNISKILEKSMHIRLVNFFRKNKLLFCYQFSFWNGYSVKHALTSLTELIRKALDEDKFALCGVFIDLQKAFDTVDYNILLSKLYHYGVKGTPHQWFKSYLTDRQQYTTINHQNSSLSNIKYGVPQGSVLGPLLFLLYNDLNKAVVHSKVHHLADDTNFLYASHSILTF